MNDKYHHAVSSSLTSWQYRRLQRILARLDMGQSEFIRAAIFRIIFSHNPKELIREALAAESEAWEIRSEKTLDVVDEIAEEVEDDDLTGR